MMERAHFQAKAEEIADKQAQYLIGHGARLQPKLAASDAAGLVRDYVRHLGQPARAIRFAIAFHPIIERWTAWSSWADALDIALTARAVGSPDEVILLLNYRSQVARELQAYEIAGALAQEALELAVANQSLGLTAISLNKLGLVAFSLDDLHQAETYWREAAEVGAETLAALEIGHINMNLGVVNGEQGHLSAAQHYFTEALLHYQRAEDPFYMAKAQCNVADLKGRVLDITGIPDELFVARDTFQRMGARYEYAMAENDIACIYLRLQRWEQARASFQTALETFEQIGALTAKAMVMSNLGELYVTTETWSRAEPVLNEAHHLALICQKPLFVAAIDTDIGRMLAAQGDLAGARERWEHALAIQSDKQALGAAEHTRQLLNNLPPP